MTSLFLSYAREDRDTAERMAAALKRSGFDVWWDRELLPGATFDHEIEQRLKASSAVVVLWSPTSTTSQWVRAEAGEAMDLGKLIPVLITDAEIPLQFKRIQTADLRGWAGSETESPFQQIVAGLRAVVGTAQVPTAGRATADPQTGDRRPAAHSMKLVSLGWYSVDFELYASGFRHFVRYKNHWTYETIDLDGREVVRGGDYTTYKSIFQFYVENRKGCFLCIVEPKIEGLMDMNLARLTRMVVTHDGQVLGEFSRKTAGVVQP